MNQCAALFASIAFFAPLGLLAQPEDRPEFEVATVKPNLSGGNLSSCEPDHHGNLKAENTSLRTLIGRAYHVPKVMVSGPGWIETQRYDIIAKGRPGASDSQVELMLQRLLEERFHLHMHREPKEMNVFLMEVANGGLKARPVDSPKSADDLRLPTGTWTGALTMSGTMSQFAGSLSNLVGRPVIDKTGIQGVFHFRLWFNNSAESEGPDLIAALREELGLRMRAERNTVETLVVDNAEKTPSEN